MFINQLQQEILNYLLNYPSFFSYTKERIITFYVLFKLSGQALNFNFLIKNPISLVKNKLDNSTYEKIFEPLYNYFKQLKLI